MVGSAQPRGYTIVELMIFLAVSGALLVSGLLAIGGQQNKTEFTQAVREMESRVNDIINDVSTGFYPNTGNIKCDYKIPGAGSGISLTSGGGAPPAQGTNSDCTFAGRIIQFAPLGVGKSGMRLYTVAAQRQKLSGATTQDVQSFADAKAQLIAKGTTSSVPDAFEDVSDNPAIEIGKVTYSGGNIGGIGIFSTFGPYKSNSLQSGSNSADLVPVTDNPAGSSVLNQDPLIFVDKTNARLDPTYTLANATSGVTVCLLSQGTNQHAVLTIGGKSGQLSTDLAFGTGNNIGDCP